MKNGVQFSSFLVLSIAAFGVFSTAAQLAKADPDDIVDVAREKEVSNLRYLAMSSEEHLEIFKRVSDQLKEEEADVSLLPERVEEGLELARKAKALEICEVTKGYKRVVSIERETLHEAVSATVIQDRKEAILPFKYVEGSNAPNERFVILECGKLSEEELKRPERLKLRLEKVGRSRSERQLMSPGSGLRFSDDQDKVKSSSARGTHPSSAHGSNPSSARGSKQSSPRVSRILIDDLKSDENVVHGRGEAVLLRQRSGSGIGRPRSASLPGNASAQLVTKPNVNSSSNTGSNLK